MTITKHRYISLIVGSAFAVSTAVAPLAALAKSNDGNSHGNANGNSGLHLALGHAKNTPPGKALGRSQNDPPAASSSTGSNGNWSGFWSNWFGSHPANASTTGDNDGDKDDSGTNNDPATTTGVTATSTSALPPVISGVSSPTVLNVGATGTWSVSASDPQNGNLSYSVDWGDNAPRPMMAALTTQPIFTQTATFTHVYSAPGTYTVKFSVKDDAGLISNTSITVHVIGTAQNPLVITNEIATSSKPTSARISWKTNLRADSEIWFGTTSPVNTSVPPQITRSARVSNHVLALNKLTPNTTYFVVVGSTDAHGNATTAPETSFTTPPEPSQAPSIGSFTGPTTLQALVQGTWTVIAADPNNSPLSYSVNWGDAPLMRALVKAPIFVQTSTFDHTYANPGTYTITVTAQNSAGLTATATTSVTVTAASTTAPILSAIAASSTVPTQATLTWNTDQSADSQVWFGTSPTVDTSLTPDLSDPAQVTAHSELLTGLTASTTYFYVVGSTNSSSQTSTSSVGSFTTGASSTSDVTPPILSDIASVPGVSTSTVTWTTNEAADSRIFYGTQADINAGTTKFLSNASLVTSHSMSLDSLDSSTTYFFVVVSADAAGNTATSSKMSFDTGSTATTSPLVVSNVGGTTTGTTATLTWNTNNSADSEVLYSTTTPVFGGSSTIGVTDGTQVTSHSLTVNNLATSTTYFFVVQSVDVSHTTASSSEISLTTPAL